MKFRNQKRLLIAFLGVVCLPVLLRGDITLPKIFSDHMVLQRNSAVKIWGMAEPEQKLVVTFNDHQTPVQANANGEWSTLIQTPGAGGPFPLQIADVEGEPKVIFTDVMVGEVWVCSGQSNMEWPMTRVLNPETEIDHAKNFPNLRLFTVDRKASPQEMEDFANVVPWSVCGPETVKNFSAVAFFFGRELSKKLNGIPIGLIHSSWGGSRCEAWVSSPSLEEVPELAPLLRSWKEKEGPVNKDRPANLFNGMIGPMTQFKIRGAIWYQGESNNGRGHQYATLFPTLIRDWRNAFGNPDFPFLFVQLAPFRYKNNPAGPTGLAEVWDAQLKTLKAVPNTGMVVTTDIGNVDDIHPKNKQEVGRRLALLALKRVYSDMLPKEESEKLVDSGPIYQSMSVVDNRIRITFRHAEGLRKRFEDRELGYFLIAGEDKEFKPANATINGDTVEVFSPDVSSPIAVRFAWTDTAEPNLVNGAGLPASPFRTDDFPLNSAGVSF
jgi:sialate O-acetylesterase